MKKVNEVRKLVGVSKRTLQYYDDKGLLSAKRSKDNYRLYDEAMLDRLWEIMVYREMKFELDEIRKILELPEEGRKKVLEAKIDMIEKQKAALEDRMEFIRQILENGMPAAPERTDGSMTYAEQIVELRKNMRQKMHDREED